MVFLTSIRGRLIFLVLLLVVPATLLVYKTALDNRTLQLAEARNRLHGIAQLTALNLQRDIRTVLQEGRMLSQVSAVRDFKEPRCSDWLAQMMAGNAELANLIVVATDGAVRCSGPQAVQLLQNYADQPYFQKAMQSGSAVVDRPIFDRHSGKHSLPIALPIKNAAGQASGLIVALLDLNQHGQLMAQSQRIPGMTFLIWDDTGKLLFRYPDDEHLSGKQFTDPALAAAIVAKDSDGTLETPGFDGVRRVFGFVAPPAEYADSGIYTGVNVPVATLYAAADALVTKALWTMAAIALIGLAAAWFIGKQLIWRQIKALSDANTRLELALDGGQLGSWDMDLVQNTTIRSLRHAQIFGYAAPAPEWSRQTFLEHVLPEDRERARQCFENALTSGQCEMELRILRADGELRWIGIQGKVQLNTQGQPVRMLGVVADITERRQADALLRESEEKFRGLLESAADGIVICDTTGHILIINKQMEALFGYSRQELIGQSIELLVPDHLRDIHQKHRHGYSRQPRMRMMGPNGQCVSRRKDGSIFPAEISLSTFTGQGGLLITATVRDISERVQAEKELRRLNRTLHMLSECNQALVRTTNENELLENICRHIIDVGGYRLAWVGFARNDPARSIEPMVHAGIETTKGYFERLQLTWADEDLGRGTAGTAIREGTPNVAHDIQSNPRFAPWCADAKEFGISSVISLPLKSKEGTFGVLSIYAAEADAFDPAEIKLLEELADDLAYGIVSLRDAAMRERFEHELEFQANFDIVTGLANRNLFLDRLSQSVIHAGRSGGHTVVLLLNLDRFTGINENLGHEAGDLLLAGIGQRLTAQLREGDTVARLSSDEFGVVVNDLTQPESVVSLAHKLLQAIVEPVRLDERDVFITASIGISIYPRDGENAETLLTQANTAMHSAKRDGGNMFHFFSAEMNQGVSFRFALSGALRRALELGELRLYYQPKVNLASGKVVGAEALARWPHNEMGMISPADFIALAEETGLIVPLGEWVLDSVCQQMRSWLDAGLTVPPVAVNLSARQFRQENLEQTIHQALQRYRLDPGLLELEITESTAMINVERAVITLHQLKALGVSLSIDDFGTGYSSLSYLKRFPLDHLKIDRAFVRDIITDPDDAAICIAIIGLAHNLKMTVIAEGVETKDQMNYLRQHCCDEMQGYYFSQPLPVAEYTQLLEEGRSLVLPVIQEQKP